MATEKITVQSMEFSKLEKYLKWHLNSICNPEEGLRMLEFLSDIASPPEKKIEKEFAKKELLNFKSEKQFYDFIIIHLKAYENYIDLSFKNEKKILIGSSLVEINNNNDCLTILELCKEQVIYNRDIFNKIFRFRIDYKDNANLLDDAETRPILKLAFFKTLFEFTQIVVDKYQSISNLQVQNTEMEEYRKVISSSFHRIKKNIKDKNKYNHISVINKNVRDNLLKIKNLNLDDEITTILFEFNNRFERILNDIVDLHIQIEGYYNPVLVGKIKEEELLAYRINRFNELEITIPQLIQRLKGFSICIKELQGNNKIEESINVKNKFVLYIDGYLLLLENMGIDIKLSPLYIYFEELKSIINDSVDLNELRLISEIKHTVNNSGFNASSSQKDITNDKIIESTSSDIDRLKNILFDNDEQFQLLKYLSTNFHSTDSRVTDLTKYSHIYSYFNKDRDYNLEQKAYKELIKVLFNFDYAGKQIKADTQKHMDQIEKLANLFKNSQKQS